MRPSWEQFAGIFLDSDNSSDDDDDMPAAELTGLAKIKFDIASEAAKLQDWWSSSEDPKKATKPLIEIYYEHRLVAPIHFDTALKVLSGLQTEAGCERIFRYMTSAVRDESSTISPHHLCWRTMVKANIKWCKPSVADIKKKYDSLPSDWETRYA